MTIDRRPDSCPSDFRLDQILARELDAREEAEVRRHIGGCGDCETRLRSFEADKEAFRMAGPPLSARPARRRRRVSRWLLAAAPAVAAAAALLLLFRPHPEPESEPPGSVRTKGGAALGFYVNHDGHVRRGASGEVVRPGDALRFTYTTLQRRYLALISIDGARRASIYHPGGPRAEAAEPGRDVALPSSVVLDDVLGEERIYGIFCSEALELEPLRQQFEARPAAPPMPEACEVDVITIEKREGE